MAKDDSETRDAVDERLLNDEYKIWKKHSPFLYDLVVTHAFEWPSLTVQWLPDRSEPPGEDYSVQKIILGTHTPHNEPNYLMLAEVRLPSEKFATDATYNHERSESGGLGFSQTNKVQIVQQIKHDGKVNSARYMPQNPFIIATKTVGAEIFVFDYSKHPSKPPLNCSCNPDLRLRGHDSEGYGLSWSPFKHGNLLSGSDDKSVCLWDINATSNNKILDPLQIFMNHEDAVKDVAWHLRNEYQFGSAGADGYLHVWDIRIPAVSKPSQSVLAHQREVSSLSFSASNEWVVATGSHDKTAKLFDLRKFSTALHTFTSHDEVTQVGWCPQSETCLASSCLGRRVMVWDLSRIGSEQTPEEAVEGPPELLFIHGGHTSRISDFSWNPCEYMVMASVAMDSILQIWQMAESIHDGVFDVPK